MSNPCSRHRLLSIASAVFCLLVFGRASAPAADPAWWNDSAGGTKIWTATPQNTENWAPVNVGQLKNVTAKAKVYLDARLGGMGGAGSAINSIVGGFTLSSPENAAPANVGQLKNVAQLFYDRFWEVGFNWETGNLGTASRRYPWIGTADPENDAPANVGQLKNLFSFTLSDTVKAATVDTDGDSIPDYWLRHYGLKSANDLFAAMESGTPVNAFGDFTAGYLSGTTFTAFTGAQHVLNFGGYAGVHGYAYAGWIPLVAQNTTNAPLAVGASQSLAPKQFWMHPGTAPGVKAVLRFKAPSAGTYRFGCVFNAMNPTGSAPRNGMDVAVVKGTSSGSSALQSASIGIGFSPLVSWAAGVTLAANDTLDFTVDSRNDWDLDSTGLFLTVTKEDTDSDGLTDLQEFRAGTNPNVQDTDGDGVSDLTENAAGLNPQNPADLTLDSDGDGIPDGVEAILRMEASSLNPPDSWAWLIPQLLKLDPYSSRDSDGDGVPDDYETVFGLPAGVPGAVYSANEAMAYRENGAPSNPFGVFKAGSGSGSGFTQFTQHTGGGGFYDGDSSLQGYTQTGSDTFPAVVVNRSSGSIRPWYLDENRPLAPHQLLLHPHHTGPDATLRFTAPADGQYSFCARFDALNSGANGVDVYVRKGTASTLLFSKKIGGVYQRAVTTGSVCTLAAGETLDFSVGANGSRDADSTGVTVTCFQIPPSPASALTYSGNELLASAENTAPSNPFSCYEAGSGIGTGFTALTQHTGTGGFYGGGSNFQGYVESATDSFPAVVVNRSPSPATFSYAVKQLGAHELLLHPDDSGQSATLRFIAPSAGNYSFSAQFRALNTAGDGVEASVYSGTASSLLFSRKIGPGFQTAALAEGSCPLAAGESLDFSVTANAGRDSDSTGLTVICTRLPDTPADTVYNANSLLASAEKSAHANPFGPFLAGYNTLGTGFSPFNAGQHAANGVFSGFSYAGYLPLVYINPASTAANGTSAFSAPSVGARQMVMYPGSTGGKAIVRFVAPVPGNYSYSSTFQRLVPDSVSSGNRVEASVLKGTAQNVLKTGTVGGTGYETAAALSGTCALTAGETLDFAVGAGPDGYGYDSTGLTLTVTRLADGPAADTDGDGLPDRAEAHARTWAAAPAAWRLPGATVTYTYTDENQDGVPDVLEPRLGLAAVSGTLTAGPPLVYVPPDSRDTDSDGAWDGQEVLSGSDPRNPDDKKFPFGGGLTGGGTPPTPTGGAVDPSLFGFSAYPGASQSAFSWFHFMFDGQDLPTSGRVADDSGDFLTKYREPYWLSSIYEEDAVPPGWSGWTSANNGPPQIVGYRRMMDDATFSGWTVGGGVQVKLVGGTAYKRIIIDTHDQYYGRQLYDGGHSLDWPGQTWNKRFYTSRVFTRTGVVPLDRFASTDPELDEDYLVNEDGSLAWSVANDESKTTGAYGEFWFGEDNPEWMYNAQNNGVSMAPDAFGGGSSVELKFPIFDWVTFHFDSSLSVRGTRTMPGGGYFQVQSGVPYGLADLVLIGNLRVSAPAVPSGVTVWRSIGISARMVGEEYRTFHPWDWDQGEPPAPYTQAQIPCDITGPTLNLIQKGSASGQAYSLSLAEDGGSRFRKISLEGLPLGDGKPQTEEETDTRADDTYVDALGLTLAHHTSDIHVPLAGSDLALSADRTLRQEAYASEPGQKAPSVNDAADEDGFIGRPFGACWTTNLAPHIVLEVDDNGKTPPMASVVDETGSSLRFAYLTGGLVSGYPDTPTQGFIPLPSPSDQTSLLNRLDIVSAAAIGGRTMFDRLDLKKRFGTVTHYEFAGYNYNSTEQRSRYYFRIRRNSSPSAPTLPGVEDRFGNRLYYTYSDPAAPTGTSTASPAIAALLIPSSVTDRSLGGRRLVITTGESPSLPSSVNSGVQSRSRFITRIGLTEDGVLQQETRYIYQAGTLGDMATPAVSGTEYQTDSKNLFLTEVRRRTDLTDASKELAQFFEYSLSYDPDAAKAGVMHAHLWLSKMRDAADCYHRFETVFDRSRKYYYSPNTSSPLQLIFQQGLDRPVSAVYFGPGDGTEQLLSEFKLQQAPPGEQAGYVVNNAYATTDPAEPSAPPAVTGNRINAVVDADRRIRYYKFTAPSVRDTKAFQNYFYGSRTEPDLQRAVLISWTQMEIDHTGGAKETYTFNPQAMMALASSEMILPGAGSVPTRTDWTYACPFEATKACAFLNGRILDSHPFFSQWYPDPSSEVRTLLISGVPVSASVPPGGSQIVKTFKYWGDDRTPKDNTKPWSRTMVESAIGYRTTPGGALSGLTRTRTTLNTTNTTVSALGLPIREDIYGPLAPGTAAKSTLMSYDPGSSFLRQTEVLNGLQTSASGGDPATSLITINYRDKYGQILKTVAGSGTSGTTIHYTQRNALGQVVAQLDGLAGGDNIDTPPALGFTLATDNKATRFTYRMDGRLALVDYPRILRGTSSFPNNSSDSDSAKVYTYDSTGRKTVEAVTNGATQVNSRTVFNYDARGRVLRTFQSLTSGSTSMEPQAGDPVTTSVYSASGLLLNQTAPSGLVTSTSYDWLRRPIAVQTQDTVTGQTTLARFEYSGYCGDSLFNSSGFKPTLTRGPALLPGTTVPATTLSTYDSLFRKVQESVEYSPGQYAVSTWAHDVMGRVISTEDPEKLRTLTSYDDMGNPSSVDRVSADAPSTSLGKTTTKWTVAGLPWEVTVEVPRPVGYSGQQTAQTRVTRTTYDAAGRAREIYLPSASGSVEGSYNQQFAYDTAGRRTVTTTRQTAAGVTPVVLLTSTTAYDARSRVRTVTGNLVDDYGAGTDTPASNAPVTETRYDSMDRPTWVKVSRGGMAAPDGSPSNAEAALTLYDRAGRVIRTVSPVAPVTDSAGAVTDRRTVTCTVYDTAGNPTAVRTGSLIAAASNADTAAWTAASSVSAPNPNAGLPSAGDTLNTYDQRGRLLTTRRIAVAGDGATVVKETFTYDAVGNRVRVRDGAGGETAFTYDALGRVVTTVHNAGASATADRDTITNTWGPLTLTKTVNARGQSTSFTYDALHNPRTVTPAGGGAQDPVETHYINAAGEKLIVSYSGASWRDASWTWNGCGRCESETSAGFTHTYQYDAAGNRTLAVYAHDTAVLPALPAHTRRLSSTYDKLNRLVTCRETYDTAISGADTSYRYNLRGGIVRKTLPNNSREDKTWDLAGRVVAQTYRSGSEISTTTSRYDAYGNLVRQIEGRPAIASGGSLPAIDSGTRTVVNTYDGVFRLTGERVYPGITTSPEAGNYAHTDTLYTYDLAGNRTSLQKTTTPSGSGAATTTTGAWTFEYTSAANTDYPPLSGEVSVNRPNQLRRIVQTTGGSSIVHFRYDADGNRTRRWDTTAAAGSAETIYTWDRSNRLVTVTNGLKAGLPAQLQKWTYGYDTRSRRLLRAAPSESAELESFSGGTSVSRWKLSSSDPATATRTLAAEFIRGSDYGGGVGGILYSIDAAVTGTDPDSRRFFEYGPRGDVTGHSNGSGSMVFRATYLAFGDHTDSGRAVSNPSDKTGASRQRASTKEEESALGLLNEGYRWRDIQTGTFLSRDPAGFIDGPNLYSYVLQNPWSGFDPKGLVTNSTGLGWYPTTTNYDDPPPVKCEDTSPAGPSVHTELPESAREVSVEQVGWDELNTYKVTSPGVHLDPSDLNDRIGIDMEGPSTTTLVQRPGIVPVMSDPMVDAFQLWGDVTMVKSLASLSIGAVKTLGGFAEGAGGSLWSSRPPGVQVRQFGDWWVKRVNPDSNALMRWWGQRSINAQYKGLQALGDMATPHAMRNGTLFTRSVGETLPDGFRLFNSTARKAYFEGSRRMGTFFNDLQPRNMGINGLIFDPAIDPVTKGLFWSGAGAAAWGAYELSE